MQSPTAPLAILANVCSCITKDSELEYLKRSLAMLPPLTPPGLSREVAMQLLAEVQEMDRRIRKLREGLIALVDLASTEQPP